MKLFARGTMRRRVLTVIVLLLLLQLWLRTVHLTTQGAFVDEGFHSMMSATIWQTGADSDHLKDGRILLYYYLSPFLAGSTTALFASRVAIALFSLVSGAVVYRLGRSLHSRSAGIVALMLYAGLPFAVFHERMALADSLAASLGCLVAWRSYVFARCPRWQEGLILGVLLALASLAKLTLILLPVLPVLASVIYAPQPSSGLKDWLRRYIPSLAVAALVMAGCWLPVGIQILVSHGRLVNSMALAAESPFGVPPLLPYIVAMLRDTMEYTSPALLIAVVLAGLFLLLNRKSVQAAFFLIFWTMISTLLIFGMAAIVAPRYLLPMAAPLTLIVAIAVAELWQQNARLPIRAGIAVAAAGWLIVFVVPFLYTALTRPTILPLTGQNYAYYIGGTLNADDTSIQAARVLDNADTLIRPDPAVKIVYGDELLCRLIYFYMQRPVRCLVASAARQQIETELAPGESAYLVKYHVESGTFGVNGGCVRPFARFAHMRSYSLDIWRIQREPCTANK